MKPRAVRRPRQRGFLPTKSLMKLLAIPFIFGALLLIVNQFLFVNVHITTGALKHAVGNGLPTSLQGIKTVNQNASSIHDETPPLPEKMYSNGEQLWRVNDFFDRVFVMNLDRRPEKWFATKYRLSQCGISAERVSARDGQSEEMQKGYQEYIHNVPETEFDLKRGKRKFNSVGAWAQSYSARDIILLAKRRGYRNFLMLEDDVLFHTNFTETFDRYIREIPATWKIVYLGATQHSWNVPGALSFDEGTHGYYHPFRTDGAFAIAFDGSVFDLLLAEIDKHIGSFDTYPVRHVIQFYPNDAFVLVPNLIVADVGSSDTQEGRNQTAMAEKLHWDMELYEFDPIADDYLRLAKVSVIITCYNAGETIFLSLRSIQQQTYRNIEIIVVDDASTDGTAEFVATLARKDGRITLIENMVNVGTYASRNIALQHATGEIITFQDADDIALQRRIELQAATINDGRALFTVAHAIRSHVSKAQFDQYFHEYITNYEDMIKDVEKSRIHQNINGQYEYCCKEILGIMTAMFHRSVFDAIGFFEEPRFSGDSEFVERLLAHYTGTLMEGKVSVDTYLSKQQSIMHVYERINDVVLYSIEQNSTLSKTIPISGEERERYRKEYQRRIRDRVNRRNPQYFWYP